MSQYVFGVDIYLHLRSPSQISAFLPSSSGCLLQYQEGSYFRILLSLWGHNIPIRPGRNLAIICESAAINHRQKKMGYNAAQELYRRVQESLTRRRDYQEGSYFRILLSLWGSPTYPKDLPVRETIPVLLLFLQCPLQKHTDSYLALSLSYYDIAADIQKKMEEKQISAKEIVGVGIGAPGPIDSQGIRIPAFPRPQHGCGQSHRQRLWRL